ncbi:MAG: hypothetical protein HC881_11250 [Leptolyngbyaceae cyanobacterium SL_7_1]|nr:hypothetical protein [Leptolyngbyaceae cyanobacterium SL_7_1]
MTETALDRFWSLVGGAIMLRSEAFGQIEQLPLGIGVAIYVALLAGLSQSFGQGIVLFINRVKPFRFLLSLLIAAVLFGFSYLFWAFSTWLAAVILFAQTESLIDVVRTLGLSYAPLLLSFLVALPYLGMPASVVLSVWSFLSFLVGLRVALEISLEDAFWCAVLGWIVFQALQNTIGRPVAAIGQRVASSVAGVKLVTNLKDLEEIVENGIQQIRSKR